MNLRVRRPLLLSALILMLVAAAASGLVLRRNNVRDRVMRADPETILRQPELAQAALSLGRDGFAAHCASCHGNGTADRARGIPDLTDGEYLYGSGQVAEIEQIVLHGIRSGDPRGWNQASMPAYARAKPYASEPIPPMTPGQVHDVVQFLMQKHATDSDRPAALRGEALYAGSGGCYDCHANDGGGNTAIGAPNLLDDVWLYGDGSRAALERTIVGGRAGISPAYARTVTPVEARAIAVYVASLSRPANGAPHD